MSRTNGIIIYICILLCFTSFIQSETRTLNKLNKYIKHYEPLSYDADIIHQKHNRAKRSVTHTDSEIHLEFSAHSKTFNLRLKRDLDTFSDNLVIVDSYNKNLNPSLVDTDHVYSGHLYGERGSNVYGSLNDGIFEGTIHSPIHGSYFVEKSSRYFPASFAEQKTSNSSDDDYFHSIIYKESDVSNPHEHPDYPAGCGINKEVENWMNSIQMSGVDKQLNRPNEVRTNLKVESTDRREKITEKHKSDIRDENLHNIYSKGANENFNKSTYHSRKKRDVNNDENDSRTSCSLFIQTDPFLWKHISEQVQGDTEKTRKEIVSLISHHVMAVNYIYSDTKFDNEIKHRNIKFEVQRIKIDEYEMCQSQKKSATYNQFCVENIDVSNFLNIHSMQNHEDFCLAYVFTYRDFTGGTLGLAWVASASGASGGICEKHKTYTENVGGSYTSLKRSLNTGIITFVNYNSRVPPKVSQLTLAHEIGHNFGSPHDYPPHCRPGDLSGNYIMFASATSGDRPNNSKFSSCSIRNISLVLDAISKDENKRRSCFSISEGAFCGNKIVEEGEECDCGYEVNECYEKCCYPRINDGNTTKGCKRKEHAKCSPSQGPCCNDDCTFVTAAQNVTCQEKTECSHESICNGMMAECPKAPPRKNLTICNGGTQVCLNGECSGSMCLKWDLKECFLSSKDQPPHNKRKLCELACMNGTDARTCRSTSEFASQFNLPEGGISLRPGSPCDNYQGYCDNFLKCRAVDADGPLVRLKNLLLDKRFLLLKWMTDNWWLCVIIAVIFICFLGMFIKCCAVHTPSSNPRKPPARRFSETLRGPIHTLRRMRRPGIPNSTQDERAYRQQISEPQRHSRQHGGGGGRSKNHNGGHRNAPPSYDRSQQYYNYNASRASAPNCNPVYSPHRSNNTRQAK